MGWQPISTAPKDGGVGDAILLARFSRRVTQTGFFNVQVGAWADDVGEWVMRAVPAGEAAIPFTPTHWQPLPEPPEAL